ncbi:MAG TPA: DUF6491 family protein [Steroidobacteraceae bacterium]|nr:DUF6491 family protein [Steroidobacteraceae bacterium]
MKLTVIPEWAARWMCLSALVTLLTACASPARRTESCERRAVLADACIRVESLAEWEPLDDRTLLLRAPDAIRGHLLGLGRPISSLSMSDEIDVVDGDLDRLICPCGHDEILVEELPGSAAPIASIEYLSEKRTAELLGVRSTIL